MCTTSVKVLLAVSALMLLPFIACKKNNYPIIPDSEYAEYISAYTSGIVSAAKPFTIEFAKDIIGENEIGEKINENILEFEPKIKYTAVWTNRRTLEIKPLESLKSETKYIGILQLSKLISVPKKIEHFYFRFQTMEQNFDINFDGPKFYSANDASTYVITGTINTADNADSTKIIKLLKSNKGVLKWYKSSDNLHFNFAIENIKRTDKDDFIEIKWNGAEIGSKYKGSRIFEIPSIHNFSLINIAVNNDNEQYISAIFSDPISRNQDFRGLIQLENYIGALTFTVNVNEIKIYTNPRFTGESKIILYKGLQNTAGGKTMNDVEENLSFEEIKPQFRFPNSGNILPSTGNIILPFEAVNLKKVDIIITKIHSNNLLQFFQVNNYDGEREVKRVGSVVLRKQIILSNYATQKELKQWNRYTIDLNDLIKKDGAALYRVELRMKPSYSNYNCSNDENAVTVEDLPYSDEKEVEEGSENEYYEDYYYDGYYDYENYSWDQRDLPCYPAYYNSDKYVAKNIITSNIGLIAKMGLDNEIHLIANDIITSEPLSGVKIDLYDFKNQFLTSVNTDGNGFAKTQLNKKPYIAVAESGKQKGYLKLDDGSSLSLSSFDVSGQENKKGMKGYIYAERGVWRPGDDMFINFILEDKLNNYNKEQPITFEIFDPNGKLFTTYSTNNNLNGTYSFKTKTNSESPTGNWLCVVKAGGNKFEKRIKIETIKPNRLKIDLNFDKPYFSLNDKNISGNIHSQWLTGATAGNLKTNITVKYKTSSTQFSQYKDYTFNNISNEIESDEKEFLTSTLDEKGNIRFEHKMTYGENIPGVIIASFTSKVFENSGNFSIRYDQIPVYTYNSYVGLKTPKGNGYSNMLTSGTSQKIEIINVLPNGNRNTNSNKIAIQVYKMDYGWWWDNEYTLQSNYRAALYNTPIIGDTLNTQNGYSSWNFKIDKPNWGMYAIKVTDLSSGHSTVQRVYFDWYGADKKQDNLNNGATLLQCTTDKKTYKSGETIKIKLPVDAQGKILLCVENGSKVITKNWFDAKGAQTEIGIDATNEMSPTAYLHVTYIQPHGKTSNDKPIRLYGIVPVNVESDNSHLQPNLITANTWKPEENVEVKVSEKNGKAMTYTLAIVDEGLLSITKYKTPNPWDYFNAKEAIGVKTWDLYNNVIGAFSSRIERLLSIGGDADEKGNNDNKNANRFKPVVKYLGPFYIGKNEIKTHNIKLPTYIGAVRIMLVAQQNGAYGNLEKTIQVKKPLMILATLPRVLSTGDELNIPVNVFALENKIKDVKVEIENSSLINIQENKTQNVHFENTGDKIIYFKCKINNAIGKAKIKVKASSLGEIAYDEIEIDIRNPNPYSYKVQEADASMGKTITYNNFNLFGIEGSNSCILEVSSLPSLNLEQRLNYLIQYPHGCIEQTTSAVFPQLVVQDIMEISDLQRNKMNSNIKNGLQRLRNFQNISGGLGYWPNQSGTDAWGTNYAGHFMVLAKQKGFDVPQSFFNNWLKYQQKEAKEWKYIVQHINGNTFYNDDAIQAYRLFTLALNNTPEIGAMNRLKEQKNISVAAQWFLASSYAISGKPEIAKSIIKNVSYDIKPYREMSFTYGSDFRDKSIILYALSTIGQKQSALPLAREIAKKLSTQTWYSTQETAYAIIALSKFSNNTSNNTGLSFSFECNGKKENINIKKSITQIPVHFNEKGKNMLSLHNLNNNTCFTRLITKGQAAIETEKSASNNVSIKILYTDLAGKILDPTNIAQGTNFMANVVVTNTGNYGNIEQLALTQIFPSGWEILNDRMSGEDAPSADFRDFRDDRVYTYFNLEANRSASFKVKLNAAYKGQYYLPANIVEAMYDKSIYANNEGKWVKVY
jgi:uncharacterized protein YfaS (alpha-2-macroglobulin family)